MSFDPGLIICQIASLQCFFYLAMGTMFGVFHAIFDINLSLDHFFTAKHIHFLSMFGWIENFCALGAAVVGAYLLSIIVEKSKKCVDFTFTLYLIHIAWCTFYYKFPMEVEWWIVNVVSSVVMASLGEYLCALKELEDIPLYSPS